MNKKLLSIRKILQIVTSILFVLIIIDFFVEFLPFRGVIISFAIILGIINFLLIAYFHKKKS